MYQPPLGARDLLPADVAQKRWIEDRLEAVFHRWGYHRIITSTVEHLDTLIAGGAIEESTVIAVQGAQDERLGLRPEVTASVARAAVTRMARVTYPQRLYYNANVFRRADKGSHGGQQESYQAGVELLGARGTMADAEIVLLLLDCIRGLGLSSCHLILGNAGLTRSLLSPFPEAVRDSVRRAIAHLDRVTLETLPLSDELHDRALQLLDLRGQPKDVLQAVARLSLKPDEHEAVTALKNLVELLQDSDQFFGKLQPSLVLDLSLIKTFDYYTGIVFEVVSDTEWGRTVIGQGGRYDNLLGVFHPQGKTYPGIGFSLNIEDLHQVLLPSGQLPEQPPVTDWLIVPISSQATAAAFAYAQKIRESANVVRVELGVDQSASQDMIRDIARQRQISRIAWIAPEGLPEIEALQ